MTVSISTLRGITDAIESKLREQKISNSDQLLEAAKTPAQRKTLAGLCDCSPRDILELANRADLNRIKGIGGAFSDLMEQAGVDTVKELAQRRADNLFAKMKEINDEKSVAKQAPAETMVTKWVEQAKNLGRAIEY